MNIFSFPWDKNRRHVRWNTETSHIDWPTMLPALPLATDDNKILYKILILCFEGAIPITLSPYNSKNSITYIIMGWTHTLITSYTFGVIIVDGIVV